MKYKISGDYLKDDSNKTLAIIKRDEIRDDRNQLMCRIKMNGTNVEFKNSENRILGTLKGNGELLDSSNQKICLIKDARREFSHPDDKIVAALYIKFVA